MPASVRPILGLVVAPEPPPALIGLLVEMHPWCDVLAAEPGRAAAAWLASSVRAPGIEVAARSGVPWALWVDDADGLQRAQQLGATLTVTSVATIAQSSGAILVPAERDAAADRIRAIPPFVRERLRRRSLLPSHLVADVGAGAVPADLIPAALAVCSACVVTGGLLSEALAWGAPTVTDAPSAASVGAGHDREVLVGAAAERSGLAEALGGDPVLAARLSHAGRRLAETKSLKRVAAQVAERLDLVRAGDPGARLEATLRLLSLPASSLQPDVGALLASMGTPAALPEDRR
ncbi:MAG: glycosyltransferase [Candidatus Dormibacteraeota bacterium]|nr:glycosyltransferase [Candidatus Dormibacteraeota bacterium]